MPASPVGMSNGISRFGVRPVNSTMPSGGNPSSPTDAGVDVPFYQSGPFWVMLALLIGYVLVFQTLKG